MGTSRISHYIITLLVWFFVSLSVLATQTSACQICVPYPEKTLADRLLENDEIIFAQEVHGSPYFFYQIEVIRGTGVEKSFKMFCDSATRRKLRVIPDSAVVLARKEKGTWSLITFADTDFLLFIRNLVSISRDWSGEGDNQVRLRFFSKLLNSENQQIHEQAYIEVGRAPYSMIKELAVEVPRKLIYDLLLNYRLIEWQNLYILILGQSSESKDREYIRDKVQSAARSGSILNLAAWVTAFIESHPNSGIEEIERMYFMSKNRTNDEIKQVMASMSVLGSQTTYSDWKNLKLRSQIIQSYSKLLENYPEMVGYVSKDLAAWRIQAHVKQISTIRETSGALDASSAYLVDYYLSVASSLRKHAFSKTNDSFPHRH